jgi:hypothetical protein
VARRCLQLPPRWVSRQKRWVGSEVCANPAGLGEVGEAPLCMSVWPDIVIESRSRSPVL